MTHWVLRKGKYWTLEESYRVPGKRTPRKRVLARKSRSGTINPAIGPGNAGLAVALPFMIVHDLVSGKRVADFKEYLASGKHHERHYPFSIVHDPRHVVSEEEWGARVSQMSRAEFDRYMAHARAEIASGKHHTNTDAMKAARGTHAASVDARGKAAADRGGARPAFTTEDEELSEPEQARAESAADADSDL
jgi:hypothetical protein